MTDVNTANFAFRSGDPRVCRNCGTAWTRESHWSEGSFGGLCQICYEAFHDVQIEDGSIVAVYDWVEHGHIRNIKQVKGGKSYGGRPSYECEAKIDGVWMRYGNPQGDACFPLDKDGCTISHYPHGIPVGYETLRSLWLKHYYQAEKLTAETVEKITKDSEKPRRYECLVSFTYDATDPADAARQFVTNLRAFTDWYVHVEDLETGKVYSVDTETNEVDERTPAGG